MRTIRIDFTNPEYMLPDGNILGKQGEHNATELLITPPQEMTDSQNISYYRIAFELTNCRTVHSKNITKSDTITLPLFSQITASETVAVQLEGYDDNENLVVKSDKITKLRFDPSVCGVEVAPSENPNSIGVEVRLNTKFRKKLEDNTDTLDKLSTSQNGNLLFDGKEIEGVGGGSASLDIEVKTDTEDEYVLEITTDTETLTTANLKGKEGKQGKSGVYVGSGDMPEGYNIQIDPEGDAAVIPTKTSDLINDSGFVKSSELPDKSEIVSAVIAALPKYEGEVITI